MNLQKNSTNCSKDLFLLEDQLARKVYKRIRADNIEPSSDKEIIKIVQASAAFIMNNSDIDNFEDMIRMAAVGIPVIHGYIRLLVDISNGMTFEDITKGINDMLEKIK